jgi:PTS system nitrogen regulatory IIA component
MRVLNKLFNQGTVLEIKSTEKLDAIRELIREARVFDDLASRTDFEKAVVDREELQSTGLGHGVAFAHGKLPGISQMKVALGISRRGIEFDSVDGRPVHLLFVVATDPSMHIDYLKCLATLARMVRLDGFQDEILSCCHEDEIERKLCDTYSRIVSLQTA